MNTQTIALDVSKATAVPPTVHIRQGDKNGTILNVGIFDNGVSLDLTSLPVRMCAKLPDGIHYYSVDGTASGNTASFEIDESYAAAYPGVTDLAYVDVLDGDDIICSTQPFRLVVEPGAREGVVPSDEHIAEIDAAVARADEAARQCEELAYPITNAQIDSIVADTEVTSTNKLSATGLTYLWGRLKAAFAAFTHTHATGDVAGAVWYGTCSTAATTQEKAVTCSGFPAAALKAGTFIIVKMDNNQTYSGSPKLNVNSTGASIVKRAVGTSAGLSEWKAGEMVCFVHDGSNWVLLDGVRADATYYGVTKLSSAIASTGNSESATPAAVNSLANMLTGLAVYSSSSTYAVGDMVRYGTGIWKCTTAITTAESWTAAHWTQLTDMLAMITGRALTPASVAATGAVSGSSISDSVGTLAALRESVSKRVIASDSLYNAELSTYTDSNVRFFVIRWRLSASESYFLQLTAGGTMTLYHAASGSTTKICSYTHD